MAKKDRVSFSWSICDWKAYPDKGTSTVSGGMDSDLLPGEDFNAAMDRVSKEVIAKLLKIRKRTAKKVQSD